MSTATKSSTENVQHTGNPDVHENRTPDAGKRFHHGHVQEPARSQGNPEPIQHSAAERLDPAEIGRLAYTYWEERGHPQGCPEEDWFRAERALRERQAIVAPVL